MSSATPMSSPMLIKVWITLPTTCPVSTDARAIGMVRNRLMMPSLMSRATLTAVETLPEVAAIRMIAGATKAM
jgi:hypothetical protein